MSSFTISLQQIEEAMTRAAEERDEAERRRVALQKIADGLRDLNGHAADALASDSQLAFTLPVEKLPKQPRGREAIRLIVRERPGIWTLAQLREELKRQGWFTSNKAVEVAAKRLRQNGEARFVRPGVYEFPTDQEERDAA
jgi:hypothetical protein